MSTPNLISQHEEIEALEAIFGPDDFTLLSNSSPLSFSIVLNPVSGGDDDENHVQLKLHFSLPKDYPSTSPPEIQYFPTKNIQNSQLVTIQNIVNSTIQSSLSLGEVAIFNICEAAKEWLISHNQPQLSFHEQMEHDRLESERVEEERRVMEEEQKAKDRAKMPSPLGIEPGTLVTKDSFLKWKILFDNKQKLLKEQQKRELEEKRRLEGTVEEGPKLTGKQLFLQNLAKELLDSEAEQMTTESDEKASASSATTVFWENEGLFADDDVEMNLEEQIAEARREEREKAMNDGKEEKGKAKPQFKSYAESDDEDDDDDDGDFDFDDDDDDEYDDDEEDDEEEEDEKKSSKPPIKAKEVAKGGKSAPVSGKSKSAPSGKGTKDAKGSKSASGKSAPKVVSNQGKGGNAKPGSNGGGKGGKEKDAKAAKGKK